MSSPRLVWLGSLFLALAPACQGKSAGPVPAKQGEAKQAGAQPAGAAAAQPSGVAGAQPAGAAAAAGPGGSAAPPSEPPANPDGKALGAQLVDPGWYRKTMFGDTAKVLDTRRSQADDQGRFSSLIRFELENMTVEACADHLVKLVEGDIPSVEREVQADGRIQLTGSTDRYSVTFICGEAKGKTIAYVSYQWT